MTHSQFDQYLTSGDFRRLFIDGLGWNNYGGINAIPTIAIGEDGYDMKTVAQRSGFQIIVCETQNIPTASVCKKIDTKLRRFANDYICIYNEPNSLHHLWVVPVKSVEKRELVCVEYTNLPQASFLFSKLQEFTFGIEEETLISDVKDRVQKAFAINSEKITKDFYAGFKKEHSEFAKFITGVNDETDVKENKDKQWYTSVMLNRLMFCYFIQKKGFLNNDTNYLRNKLEWSKAARGKDKFFDSFYKGFLIRMFHDGLNAPSRDRNENFEDIYGRIPYLNGGMFDEHQIEKNYKNLDIADGAFERLFDFFDKWEWHLDTRVTATGKDINPDVLGYIFEQYINDRAQMGAYYTKEDITEYIGKNCIIPFLFDKVAKTISGEFSPTGYVWMMLKESGVKYFYPAAIKGWSTDWKEKLPENIKIGLDTTRPNLMERRSHWNENTSEEFALPTEIWRETIERLKHCDEIVERINAGEITSINDFITYNLDIRSFIYDILASTKNPKLIKAFYEALQNISILDPTCGSGAFLFAAMNILEPLYEICIERMQEFNEVDHELFKEQLDEITDKYRSNIQYFIFKSIILRNLYGVDIMVEATEIAKLRLFLKMVAVVEVDKRADNMGLDPLPDIDFNIRCGNTLVGYATEAQLNADLEYASDLLQQLANQELKEKLEKELKDVADTYEIFRLVQLEKTYDMSVLKQAKKSLQEKLISLNELLNKHLFTSSGFNNYGEWLSSHQPFNWLAEYYHIMHNGGFDVIIGNPPYVVYNSRTFEYKITNYTTNDCNDLYAYVIERALHISQEHSSFGMIVPISIVSTDGFLTLREELSSSLNTIWYSNYAMRPGKLFDGAEKHLSIVLGNKFGRSNDIYSSKYNRWYTEERPCLFSILSYIEVHDSDAYNNSIPKIGSTQALSIWRKLLVKHSMAYSFSPQSNHIVYHTRKLRYFVQFLDQAPIIYNEDHSIRETSELKKIYFESEIEKDSALAIYLSSLFFWFFITSSDCRNLNKREVDSFPCELNNMQDAEKEELSSLGQAIIDNLQNNSYYIEANYQKYGRLSMQTFRPRLSKQIADRIDIKLGGHYSFTEEEKDYILNYDIKYRMGEDINESEES